MYNSGDAAEQVVRISLEGTEVALSGFSCSGADEAVLSALDCSMSRLMETVSTVAS